MIHGLWTAALLVAFIGIVAWAWSGRRKRDFDAAARIPLEEDEADDIEVDSKGSRDG